MRILLLALMLAAPPPSGSSSLRPLTAKQILARISGMNAQPYGIVGVGEVFGSDGHTHYYIDDLAPPSASEYWIDDSLVCVKSHSSEDETNCRTVLTDSAGETYFGATSGTRFVADKIILKPAQTELGGKGR